jgi:hypothetical protein
MGKQQSNLSSTGFDYVVAVTQDSINAMLGEALDNQPSVVQLFYVFDSAGNISPIDFATLLSKTGGIDPFSIQDQTSPTDERVQALSKIGFFVGVNATPVSSPPAVNLIPGEPGVGYEVTFAQFVVVGPLGNWFNQVLWNASFTGFADLSFRGSSIASLSSSAQQRLKDIGDPNMFSILQLYFDLRSSVAVQSLKINGAQPPPPGVPYEMAMAAGFMSDYLAALGASEDGLGYGAKQLQGVAPSGLAVTDLAFRTSYPFGPPGTPLALNYLCAINGNKLPDPGQAEFPWNWIDAGEAAEYDGVAALNRNTFADCLASTLADYMSSNCYKPSVTVTLDGTGADYDYHLDAGQTPTRLSTSGSSILEYSYGSATASDEAGFHGDVGAMKLASNYQLVAAVQGNQMTVVQHLVVWCYVSKHLVSDQGNVVDKTITDTYSLGIDDTGKIMVSSPNSVTTDNSKTPGVDKFLNFWSDVNSLSKDVADWARTLTTTSLTDVPMGAVQSFVFPGGRSFVFSDVSFSDNQDLVAHIVYADLPG